MIDPLSMLLHRQAGQHGPVMLMYHSVAAGSSRPDWPWAVSMAAFRAQLDFLRDHGWATPTMAELLASPAARRSGRTAVITFDDGYEDNLAACEELQRRAMRATWFIVSGSLGRTPAWPATGRPAIRLLDAAQLREMAGAGMEIGSHTHSHLRMPALDDAALAFETRHSRTVLADALGRGIDSFAYPYGAWDARCAAAVEAAGYRGACTTRTGWALRDGDPFGMRRLTLYNADTTGSFIRKLASGRNDVAWPATLGRLLAGARARAGL